jgi:hypothetical protein
MSTIPVDFTWTGTGAESQLEMATGTSPTSLGAFNRVTLSDRKATSTRVKLVMGPSTGKGYQLRVRSCADATKDATCGTWAPGPKFTLLAADDELMGVGQFKGPWARVTTVTGAYNGTVRRASGSATATLVPAVTFTVSGNAAWVSTLGPDQGLAQVQVDGGRQEVVDLYSPTVEVGRVVWARDALAAGTHTVSLTVLGKKSTLNPGACNTGAKCAQVDIDMVAIIK